MIYVLYGALGVLGVLALLGGGFAGGWAAHRLWQAHSRRRAAQEVCREERQAAEAEQRAFEGMLSYNMDTAYGLGAGAEDVWEVKTDGRI